MSPHLRIVYRSAAVENTKPRPPYYSKTLALASVLRAAEPLGDGVEFVFVNDGEIPRDRLALMQAHGTVRPVDGGSNRSTFRAAVAREAALAGGADDLVWFAEDDYLYAPDALTTLRSAATAFPDTDYFALYGSDAFDTTVPDRPVRRRLPGAENDPHAPRVGAAAWFRARATTSTFGVRRHILREDALLLRFMPFTGGAWDTATCLALQGHRPFGPADLLPDPDGSVSRGLLRGMVRAAVGAGPRRRPSRRRVLRGADPELAWHMEIHDESTRGRPSAATSAVDWNAIAVDTMFWAADRSIPVPTGSEPARR